MCNYSELSDYADIKYYTQKHIKTGIPETMLELITAFVIHMRADRTVPAPIMNSVHFALDFDTSVEVEDIFPKDYEPAQRCCLIENEGEIWMPLFTDQDESVGFDGNAVIDIPIRTIVEDALYEDGIAGMVINPFNEALVLRKEMLELILHLTDESDIGVA